MIKSVVNLAIFSFAVILTGCGDNGSLEDIEPAVHPKQVADAERGNQPELTAEAARRALLDYFAYNSAERTAYDEKLGLTKAMRPRLIESLRKAEVVKNGKNHRIGDFVITLDTVCFHVNARDGESPSMLGWFRFDNGRWVVVGPFRNLGC
jgi:hypothetical protein